MRVGETARLHLNLETEARYDTLAALGGVGTPENPVYDPGDLILHLRPGLRLLAPGADASFEGAARLDYQYFTGLGGPTQNLSYLGAFVDAGLLLARGGPWGLRFDEHFSRSDRTANPSLGVGSLTDANTASARLEVRPGGGALELGLGYTFAIEAYELHFNGNVGCNQTSCDGSKYGGFGSTTHQGSLDARWRFFPKTALLIESSWAARSYESSTLNVGTSPLRASAGLIGLLTEKVRVVIKGGYANTFAQKGESFSGFIGQLEVGYEPGPVTRLAVGVQRSVEPVSDLYGWYSDYRGYATGQVLLGGRLLFTGSGSVDSISFANKDGRQDLQAQAGLALEYQVTELFRAALGGQFTFRDSSEAGPFNYARTELFARLTVSY